MMVFTIGFTKKTAEQFFTRLKQPGLQRVVDTRLNNVSQLAGFTKKDDLRYFLREVGQIDYVHVANIGAYSRNAERVQKKRRRLGYLREAVFSIDGRASNRNFN